MTCVKTVPHPRFLVAKFTTRRPRKARKARKARKVHWAKVVSMKTFERTHEDIRFMFGEQAAANVQRNGGFESTAKFRLDEITRRKIRRLRRRALRPSFYKARDRQLKSINNHYFLL